MLERRNYFWGYAPVPKISLKQIALEAGVSPSLVSQVFNNREVRVSESTRKRILEIASKYHYKPNRLASGLKLKHTGTIAVIIPFTPVGFFSELIYHIEAYAMEAGYNTMVLNTFGNREKEMEALELCQTSMADGILFAPQDLASSRAMLMKMKEENYPFVFVDRYVNGVDIVTVSSDHAAVAYALTAHLMEKGCDDIVFIKRDDEVENSTKRDRMRGYVSALEEHALSPQIVGFNYGAGDVNALCEKLGNRKQPEGIFLFSGFYMPYLLNVCRQLSYDMEAIQFVTVDSFIIPFQLLKNTEIQYRFNNNLYVAVQDISMIAKQAVSSLITWIRGGKTTKECIDIPVEFVSL